MNVSRGTMILLHERMSEGMRLFAVALSGFADELDGATR
jgi:hypothetical protein